jgi:LysM repeat protein
MDSRIWKVIIAVAALHVLVLGSMFLIQHGCKQTSKEPGLAQPEPAPPLPPVAPSPPPPGGVQPGVVTTITPGTPVAGSQFAMVTPPPTPPPTPSSRTYLIKQGDTLGKVAKTEGVTLDALLAANPGIDPKKLRIGQEIQVPEAGGHEAAGAAVAGATTTPSAPKVASSIYTVKKGDTLGKIARAQGTTVTALKKANKLSSDDIRVGQKLKVPSPHESGQRPPREATMAKSDLAPAESTMGDGTTHIVQSGETPEIIAKKYGVSTKALLAANGNPNPKKLKVGQKLVVPTKAGEAAPAAPSMGATPAAPSEGTVTDTAVSGQAVAPPATFTPSETLAPPSTAPAPPAGH